MWQLEMYLWRHVVYGSYEGLGVLIEARGEYEVSNLQIEVVIGVDVEILGFQVSMSKSFCLYGLKSIDELLEIVSCYRLRKPSSFAQDHKKIRLICRKDKISVIGSLELYQTRVQALYHIGMIDNLEHLSLILGLIDLSLLHFVQLYKDFHLYDVVIFFDNGPLDLVIFIDVPR